MIEWLDTILLQAGSWVRGHVGQIALALVATLLVIYGNDINRTLKIILRPYHRLLRLLGFVLMCAFGYGALTVFFTPLLANVLVMVDTRWMAPMVVGAFLLLGFLAERKHQL
ncbi:Protein of unknown function [Ectothiorhodospira magna]|uniref:DUF3392 domain-containing protein n=1 Tax=Ectothiorhodospira magna TaxID=867345 RepID=A0A1H9B4C9_9GAMM|nr:DUF3392 domain-containing protein [Ectothiorhodospira magna]SEP83587.1 Protein of unknown function [Ectothiorhodospira magna]